MNIQAEIPDKVISGLYKREGRRSSTWIVKARQRGHGKVVRVTIGRADVISVLDARAKAKQLLAQLSEGINPNEQKRLRVDAAKSMERLEEALKISLKDVLDAYLSQKQLKERTKQDYMETFTRNFSDLLGRPVRSLTRELLLERFQQIKKRVELKRSDLKERLEQQGRSIVEFASKPGVGEAQRAFRYLRSVLNSIRNDRIDGVKILEENPCDVISDKRLHQVLEPRDRYLNLSERRAVVEVMEIVKHPEYKGKLTASDVDFVWLIMVTGLRLEEARNLMWANIDFIARTFTVKDTKNKRNHTLPMTRSVEGMLSVRRSTSQPGEKYVFPSSLHKDKPSSMSRTFDRINEESGVRFSAHDLRRTIATIAAELGHDLTRISGVLNHKKRGVTQGYIQTTVEMLRGTLEDVEVVLLEDFESQQ